MAIGSRFALRDAGEATFYRLTGDKGAIVTLDTLKTSGVETTGETTYAMGGFGNAKLVGFSSNRESTINLEDALFDKHAIAMLTGNELVEGAKIVDRDEKIEIKKNGSDYEAIMQKKAEEIISVFILGADGSNKTELKKADGILTSGEYGFDEGIITIHENDFDEDGTMVRVYYTAKTGADTSTMRVTTDAFGGTFRVSINILVRDAFDQQDYLGQLRIPRAKFEDDFTLDLDVAGDPATLSLPLEILKDPLSTNMWELVIYDDEDIDDVV